MRRAERGQALVELAVALPVLLMLLLAVIEFGFMFSSYLQIQNGAREAARFATLGAADHAVRNRVLEVTSSLDSNRVQVEITPPADHRYPGSTVTVNVSYAYETLIPGMSRILDGPVTLTAGYKMRVE